ncbi:MAG: NAD-dependent epimerase [Pseudomonadota bacterium]
MTSSTPASTQSGADPAAWAERLRGGGPVLVTGAAGFIGHALADRLLKDGLEVVGFDNLNAYYDPALKAARLSHLQKRPGFRFVEGDLADAPAVDRLFSQTRPDHVVHLAAQAGVRYSIDHPRAYAESNLTGFLNILEGCRHGAVRHLIYASSSSVYGGNTKLPFATGDQVDHPVSLYAATKKANELMAHTYSHLYDLPATGLRFFTVYGPWGRPDMAYYKFARAIAVGQPIEIYNHGEMERDFTYIDDVIESLVRLIPILAMPDPGFDRSRPSPASSWAPHRVYNIGNHRREKLMDLIAGLEHALGREALKTYLPMQPGDVQATWADVTDLEAAVGYRPDTPLAEGLARFVTWYRAYHSES